MRTLKFVVTSLATLALGAGSALAQSAITPVPAFPGNALLPANVGPEGTTVANRPRPDYDPVGYREGGFLFFPSLGVTANYDSNIYATPSGAKGDFFGSLRPALSVQSDWSRNALALNVGGIFNEYAHYTTEDNNNLNSDLRGRYDIENGTYFLADVGYSLLHEDRASPNAVFGKYPTEYHVTGAYFSYVRQPGQLGLRLDSTLTSYDYNNTVSSGGVIGFAAGQTIPQNFRDRIELVVAPRITYEIQPGYSAYARFLANDRQYNSPDPFLAPPGSACLTATPVSCVGQRRNSHGFEGDIGTAIEVTRIVTAEVYVGYLDQKYESPLLAAASGPAFGGNLLWNVTPITSVKGALSQSVAETDVDTNGLPGVAPANGHVASSSNETNLNVSVEHELLRNVLLLGGVGYVRDDYNGISRVDNTYLVNAGARYMLNRMWRATADISYSERNSSVGANYNRVIGTLGVTANF
jgi:hypothetical protein